MNHCTIKSSSRLKYWPSDWNQYNIKVSPIQSAPTKFVLKTWFGLWPWKKLGRKYALQKSGCKKRGQFYSKREEALSFATHILDSFFKVPDPKKISGRRDKLQWWVQIDWAIVTNWNLQSQPLLSRIWISQLHNTSFSNSQWG